MSPDYVPADQEYLLGQNESKKHKNKCTLFLCIGIISGCLGISLGILGPTLPCLESVTETQEDQISLVFTSRAVGALSGILLARLLISGSPVFVSSHTIVGYGLLILAAVNFIIPWPTFFWWLLPLFTVQGSAIAAILEGCLSSFSSFSWRYVNHLQRFIFFTTVVGCALSPIIALPFFPDPFSVKNYDHFALQTDTKEDLPSLPHVRHKRSPATSPNLPSKNISDSLSVSTVTSFHNISVDNATTSLSHASNSNNNDKKKSPKPTYTEGHILNQDINNADGSSAARVMNKILSDQHTGKIIQKVNNKLNDAVSPNSVISSTAHLASNSTLSTVTTDAEKNTTSSTHVTTDAEKNTTSSTHVTNSAGKSTASTTLPPNRPVSSHNNGQSTSHNRSTFHTKQQATITPPHTITTESASRINLPSSLSGSGLILNTTHSGASVTTTAISTSSSNSHRVDTSTESPATKLKNLTVAPHITEPNTISTNNSSYNNSTPFHFKILGHKMKTVHKIYACIGVITLIVCLITSPLFLCYSRCSKREKNAALRSALSDEDVLDIMTNSSSSQYRHHLEDRATSPRGLHYCVSNLSLMYLVGLAIIFLLSVLANGMAVSFGGFLYSFVVRYLQWTQFKGLMITSLFWVSLSAGHFISLSPCWSALPALLLHQVVAFACSIFMSVTEPYRTLPFWFWLSAGVFGLAVSGLSSSLNSWMFSLSRGDSPLTSILQVGCILGEMFIPVVIGYLHRTTTHPTIFLNVILVCCSAYVFLFVVLIILVKKKQFPMNAVNFLGRPPPNFEYVIQSTDNEEEPGDSVPLTKTTQIVNGSARTRHDPKYSASYKSTSRTHLVDENEEEELDELGL